MLACMVTCWSIWGGEMVFKPPPEAINPCITLRSWQIRRKKLTLFFFPERRPLPADTTWTPPPDDGRVSRFADISVAPRPQSQRVWPILGETASLPRFSLIYFGRWNRGEDKNKSSKQNKKLKPRYEPNANRSESPGGVAYRANGRFRQLLLSNLSKTKKKVIFLTCVWDCVMRETYSWLIKDGSRFFVC